MIESLRVGPVAEEIKEPELDQPLPMHKERISAEVDDQVCDLMEISIAEML